VLQHQNILKVLKNTKLPIPKGIWIENLWDFNEPDIINKFLSEAVTKGTQNFKFKNSNTKLDKDE